MRPADRVVGRRRADQDVADVPGGDRIKQTARGMARSALSALAQLQRRTFAREPGIEHHEIGELDADAAEAHGEPRRPRHWATPARRRLGQPRAQAADADFVKHATAGTLSDICSARARDGALEGEIEILRLVVAEPHRLVVYQSLRMRQTVRTPARK